MSKKVIIVGGGFGGLTAAKELKDEDFEILLIDKTNHHLFQPLLYQVATAALSPGDIAVPIRSIFSSQKNVSVLMEEVTLVDKENNFVIAGEQKFYFDYLILAPGSKHSFFGNNSWEKFAPGLKTLDDALSIRENLLFSLEEAEKIPSKKERNDLLTFIVVGGGPTGVEMAGAIAETTRKTVESDFRKIKPDELKIILVEASSRILPSYSFLLSKKALKDLEQMGVEILLNKKVTDINETGIQIDDKIYSTRNIIWAAGNAASSLLKSLNVSLDYSGRVKVNSDLSIEHNENIFVIGDAANILHKGKPLPGIAPVAIQQGKYVANLIKNNKPLADRKPFKYFDKGSMATIGRAKAIAELWGMQFSGYFAWLIWCFIHILYLIGFRNRFRVMAEWIWYYFTFKRGISLITGRTKII